MNKSKVNLRFLHQEQRLNRFRISSQSYAFITMTQTHYNHKNKEFSTLKPMLHRNSVCKSMQISTSSIRKHRQHCPLLVKQHDEFTRKIKLAHLQLFVSSQEHI